MADEPVPKPEPDKPDKPPPATPPPPPVTHAAVRLRIVELLNDATLPYDVAASALLATATIAADKAMDVVESVATMYKHLGAEKIKSLLGNPPVPPPEQAKVEETPSEPQRPPTQLEE